MLYRSDKININKGNTKVIILIKECMHNILGTYDIAPLVVYRRMNHN